MQNTIFLNTQSPVFTISTAAASGTITYSITDYLCGHHPDQVAVNGKQTAFSVQNLPDNHYVLTVTDRTTQTAITQTISFAVLAPFTPSEDEAFGVSADFSMHDPLDAVPIAATLGITLVRVDAKWAKMRQQQASTISHR